jgi:DNA polymerase III subunit delta
VVAVRAANASSFAEAPTDACSAVLVFGTDEGLVSERARLITNAFAKRDEPPAEVIRIEDTDLENEPDRLLVELQTVPMFGGGKVVRSTLGRRVNGALFKQVFDAGPPPALLVVEGGNLKPSDAARKLFESAPWAAAVPCYADTERDLAAIANDMMRAAGRKLEADAQAVLLERLGADRALSRGEIDKLLLYTTGRSVVTADDVLAAVGDASDFKMDQIVSSAAAGEGAAALRDFDRACAAGESPQTLLLAMQRYFVRLHRLRAAVDAGSAMEDAMRRLRPPVHFSQKDALSAQCRGWSLSSLSNAIARISAAVKSARLNGNIEAPLAERLLIDLAAHARSRRR